ncbi:MAG: excinuclease ABC subunit UvrB [Patescibacteria group bacterium]
MMKFKLKSAYKPSGGQPQAIVELVKGLDNKIKNQTLLGVTGSGKTFTIANVIEKIQKPTLVIAHNKTLAAQLCNEFREFFPENAVEYFVSYYDYYQPESYLPNSDTYIEKEAQINGEIDRLRHAATQALLSRKDVIIVASVSAIYGLGSPLEYGKKVIQIKKGEKIDRHLLLKKLVDMQFNRSNLELSRGMFRMRGQVFEIMPVNEERIYRFEVSDKIDKIDLLDAISRKIIRENLEDAWFFPAKHYVVDEQKLEEQISLIKEDLKERLDFFKKQGKILEYERLKRKTNYDLELIKEIGYCNGIENYSRYFDGRNLGDAPYTLLDYFKKCDTDFLTVIDESHVTLPQIRAMYNGDKSRKDNLIEYGFRLPSARDNRPLKFKEFLEKVGQMIFVSATPAEFEFEESQKIVEQIVRPTGLIDPEVIIRPINQKNNQNYSQIEDVILEIKKQVTKKEKTLITTLSKKQAENLTEFLKEKNIKVEYLHSDVKTIDRIDIITKLRKGEIDVIVGVNLLREGLDIPEVSLVAILDADKEGFLRNETSLIQTIGRSARNVNGRVILYADIMTDSIKKALSETERRRQIQLAYNKKNNITPKTIEKNIRNILEDFGISPNKKESFVANKKTNLILDLDLIGENQNIDELIKTKEKQMREASKKLEFELATILRDEVNKLKMQNVKLKKVDKLISKANE